MSTATCDVIGGFPVTDPNCKGCGVPLQLGNAWMTDGCPCNSPLGINSKNETRWRLLMQLQQEQSRELEKFKDQQWVNNAAKECSDRVLVGAGEQTFAEIIARHARS